MNGKDQNQLEGWDLGPVESFVEGLGPRADRLRAVRTTSSGLGLSNAKVLLFEQPANASELERSLRFMVRPSGDCRGFLCFCSLLIFELFSFILSSREIAVL